MDVLISGKSQWVTNEEGIVISRTYGLMRLGDIEEQFHFTCMISCTLSPPSRRQSGEKGLSDTKTVIIIS